MSATPLTHHEILALVAPFTRADRHVDLRATDRAARRIVFQPVAHPAQGIGERLELTSLGTGTCRLRRILTTTSGLEAVLEALGPDPTALLAVVGQVDVRFPFHQGPGYEVACSYTVRVADTLVMTEGVALLDGLRLEMHVSGVRGVAADILITPTTAATPALPEDLVAVLGWHWTRLVRNRTGWKTKLRLRGDTAARTRRAEDALQRCAAHVAEVLAAPPAQYHTRYRAARWGAFFRRGIPVLTFIALVLAVITIPGGAMQRSPRLWMLLYHVPTALIVLSFCLQELPQYEIPPPPRPLSMPSWRTDPDPGL